MRRVPLLASALALVAVLGSARLAVAHPPYESVDRVIKASDGRAFTLVRTYTDGIFFTDPVHLIIRDQDERTTAETPPGRDLAILCRGERTCLVFRYDALVSFSASNAWSVEDGRLVERHTKRIAALGVIAPLLDSPGAYLLSLGLLAAPAAAGWLVFTSARRRGRHLLVAAFSLFAFGYGVIWLYGVVLLSSLSLPLVLVTGVGSGLIAWRLAAPLRQSAASAAIATRVVRMAAIGVAVLLGVGVLGVMFVIGRMVLFQRSLSFEEPAIKPPLKSARVTRASGKPKEVFLETQEGLALGQEVDVTLFQGFDSAMRWDDAERKVGPPSGHWTDPVYSAPAVYYDRPAGRVSLVRRATEWLTVGHRATCRLDDVLRDPLLREQLREWLPKDGDQIEVHIRSADEDAVTLGVAGNDCRYLVLTMARQPQDGKK
jgi:hypothetical protein